ncbi:DoxX family protein [Mucilaginibacter auburnensis]|uniref:DoxX-like protein n=1 Tax=Mucilaginibacter auburnensis TaxID=1457233 RepID=A0A2H9VUL5_9SPHI|nr:DoxX family protein [Mucilaginibacter auburnensis]PJJ84499.1 DoxX-like protein [Mucilaginibacter auburnensis]
MNKRNKIIYWVVTLWLALGMTSTAIVQLLETKDETAMMAHLGYPRYLLIVLGVWKIAGVITVLLPKFTLLKEWAYASFFFAMSGAVVSHLVVADGVITMFGSTLLIVLTIISWCSRPPERKLINAKSLSI